MFFFTVARAPGWRHYRSFSLVALAGSAYSLLSLGGIESDGTHWQPPLLAALSLMVALTSATIWLRFDSQQAERRLSLGERAASALLLLGTALCLIPGVMIGPHHKVSVQWMELDYHVPSTTFLADVFITILMLTMGQLLVRYAYRAWAKGESWIRVAATLVFIGGEIEEGLVATETLSWPFLGPIGFALGTLFMAIDLGVRVSQNANELARLNRELELGIARRTEELVVTREALMATERQVALGQLAAGVGHEVNNPLTYVKGNLDFLRDQLRAGEGEDEEAILAIEDALHGSDRIRQVVDNLVTYARSAPVTGAAQVASAVDVAMRVVRPQSKFTMRIEVALDDVDPVAIDESKLIQVVVNVLINAAQSSRDIQPIPTARITAAQEGNQVVLKITDDGCGVLDAVAEQLLHPSKDSHLSPGSAGLGVFLSRALVEAAGGSLEVESEIDSGTAIVIRLKCSPLDLPSISDTARRLPVVRMATRPGQSS